jgi:hypothetical protein
MAATAQRPAILRNDLHPDAIDLWFTAKVGPQYYTYLPETLQAAVRDEAGQPLGRTAMARVQATCAARDPDLTSTTQDWDVFCRIAASLAGQPPLVEILPVPSPGDLLGGTDALLGVRRTAGAPELAAEGGPLSGDVLRYCACVAANGGLVYLPDPLHEAQVFLERLTGVDSAAARTAFQGARKEDSSAESTRSSRIREAVALLEAHRSFRKQHLAMVREELRRAVG